MAGPAPTEANVTARPKHAVARVGKGHFAPGVSGNPNGRKAMPEEVRQMLFGNAEKAVQAIIDNLGN